MLFDALVENQMLRGNEKMKEKYVIFGASVTGTKVFRVLHRIKPILFFVDNDKNRWGEKEGLEVIGPEELIKRDSNREYNIIIASVNYFEEIRQELLQYGYSEERILRVDRVLEGFQQGEYECFFLKYKIIGEDVPVNISVEKILNEFKEAGFPIRSFEVDLGEYEKWLEEINYEKNFPKYCEQFGEIVHQKQAQHYISIKLLNDLEEKIVLDVASSFSVFPEIAERYYKAEVYRQDMEYPTGVSGHKIGSFASEIPLQDDMVDYMTLHCSLEHFEGQEDVRFFSEANRLLKKGGKVCVIPLYMADEFCIVTSPESWLDKYKSYTNCPDFDERASIIINNKKQQRQSKFYSVGILKQALLDTKTGLKPTIFYISNYQQVNEAHPFVLILEKE